jgi:hypothetical protein
MRLGEHVNHRFHALFWAFRLRHYLAYGLINAIVNYYQSGGLVVVVLVVLKQKVSLDKLSEFLCYPYSSLDISSAKVNLALWCIQSNTPILFYCLSNHRWYTS